MKAWHFVGEKLRDGRPVPPDGEWLEHDGPLQLCASGLHASARLIDALQCAPGSTICRVEMGGSTVLGDDKLVASRRCILWRVDGKDLLRRFARRCALDVIHLWDPPDAVLQYLHTGREGLRLAAWYAARDAADDATTAAIQDAARAARYAADSLVPGEAWDAAEAARWAAAVASDPARPRNALSPVCESAWTAQNLRLTRMVHAAHRRAA